MTDAEHLRQRQTQEVVQQEDRTTDTERFADAKSDDDAERDRLGECREIARQNHARICKREDGHDDVRRPRLEAVLERIEQGTLGMRAVNRDGEREDNARNRRMNARVEKAEPREQSEQEIRCDVQHASAVERKCGGECRQPCEQGNERKTARVEQRDDNNRAEIIDDGKCRQKDDNGGRGAACRDGENAQRKGDVRRHRDAPARHCCGVAAHIDRSVEECGDEHPPDGCTDGENRRRERLQLTEEKFALDFQSDDEEENRHQTVVDPVEHTQIEMIRRRPCDGNSVKHSLIAARKRTVRENDGKRGEEEQEQPAECLVPEKGLNRLQYPRNVMFHERPPIRL